MLKNKLGIDNPAELAREEERISKKKAAELFEKGILNNLQAVFLHYRQYIGICLRIFTILQAKYAR